MLPVLIRIGPVTIYTFGILIFISLVVSLFVIWRRGLELRFNESDLIDLTFIILFIGIISARIGYIGLHWLDFGLNPLNWINLAAHPGLWYPAGLTGLIIGSLLQARKRKWDLYSTTDTLSVGVTIGLCILSFGAFLNGSGLGGATNSILGLRFPGLYDKRLPVPLYETLLYGLLFRILWKLEASYRTISWYRGGKSQAKPGFITSVFLMLHGLIALGMMLLKPPVLAWGVPVELIWYSLIFLLGVRVLILQSANSLPKMIQAITKDSKTAIKRKLGPKNDPSQIQFFK